MHATLRQSPTRVRRSPHLRFKRHGHHRRLSSSSSALIVVACLALIVGGSCSKPTTKTVLRLVGEGAPSAEALVELSLLAGAAGLLEIDRTERPGSLVVEFAPGIDDGEREALQAFLDGLTADPPRVADRTIRLEITESDTMLLALAGLSEAPKSYDLHLDVDEARLLQFDEWRQELKDTPSMGVGGVGALYEPRKVRQCGYFIPFDEEVPRLSFQFPGEQLAESLDSDRVGVGELFREMGNLPPLTVSHRIIADDPALADAMRGLQIQMFQTEDGDIQHALGVILGQKKLPRPGEITSEDLARVARSRDEWGAGPAGRLARGIEAALDQAREARRPPPSVEERAGWCRPQIRGANPAFARAFIFPELAAWLSSAKVDIARR